MTLREQVFRKMGWSFKTIHGCSRWVGVSSGVPFNELPLIDEQWEVCARYLVPFMRERFGVDWYVRVRNKYGKFFCWAKPGYESKGECNVENHNIAEAACKAFLEVKPNE